MTTLRVSMMIAAAGALLASSGFASADQVGQAGFPSPSARVGGGLRMALPTPRINGGRNGTLLNRGGSLLPPPVIRSRPDGGGKWGGGRPTPFPGRVDTGTGGRFPVDGTTTGDGPFYDRGGVAANGTTISGSTQSDRFRLRWHIGAGCNKPCWGGSDNCWPRNCNNVCFPTWWSGWWWFNSGFNNYPNYVYSGPWYGTDPFVTQGAGSTYPSATTPANTTGTTEAPRQLSPIELADEAWQAGRWNDAARYFKEYLAGAPDDTDAMRFLALVYIDQRKLDEAVALMAMAYEKTPQLASRPLPAGDIPGGDDQMRRRVNTMSGYANRSKTGSAWLMMAVLVQSEGRDPIAKTMAERAAKAGLSEKVAGELIGSLSD